MVKNTIGVFILLFVFFQNAQCQTSTLKIPDFTGNVNDWESLFTDAQKSSLDSACTIFAYQTNIPVAVVTFGKANTSKENSNEFIQQADSLLYQNGSSGADVAIFLSKEFRALSFKANAPVNMDTSKLGTWKEKMQQIFNGSIQLYIPLLKQGKYAEALIAVISDLAVAVKKEM